MPPRHAARFLTGCAILLQTAATVAAVYQLLTALIVAELGVMILLCCRAEEYRQLEDTP